MPALDTERNTRVRPPKAKKKPVYGPPAPKPKPKPVYGPPAPRPTPRQVYSQPRTPRKPTAAEKTAGKSRQRVRDIEAKNTKKQEPGRRRSERREREAGPFSSKPVAAFRNAEGKAIEALHALREQDPKKYDDELAKRGLKERATAGYRGQTIEHFKGRKTGEVFSDRPTKKLGKKKEFTVAGYRGQTKPTKQMGFAGDKIVKTAIQNLPKDVADTIQNMPTSIAATAVEAYKNPLKAAANTVKPYIEIVKDPEKAVAEHPASTALTVGPLLKVPGLAAGKVARIKRGVKARRAGRRDTDERPAATVPGTAFKERQAPSRTYGRRERQRAKDEKAHGAPHATAKDVERRVDEFEDFRRNKVAQARDKAAKEAKDRGMAPEEAKGHIEAAATQMEHQMQRQFAHEFGAHARPAVGEAEMKATKAERERTKTAKEHAGAQVKTAKADVRAAKAERGKDSEQLTAMEAQRAALQKTLADQRLAEARARTERAQAHGSARASTAKPKTSETLKRLEGEHRAIVKEKPPQTVLAARQRVSEADRQVAALERTMKREQERASQLEGVTEGRFKAGKMTTTAGRAAANQAERIGMLTDEIAAARKTAASARDALKAIEAEARAGQRARTQEVRGRIRDEKRRIAGVAPAVADTLLGAIENVGRRGAEVAGTRGQIRMLDDLIGAGRGALRESQRAAVHQAEQRRQGAQQTFVQRRGEHAQAKAHDKETKRRAATAPIVSGSRYSSPHEATIGSGERGRVYASRYDADKVAQQLNAAGHTINVGGKAPLRYEYHDDPVSMPGNLPDAQGGVRLRRSGDINLPLEFTVRQVGDNHYAVVPKIASERLDLHGRVGTSPATGAMLMRDSRHALTQSTLPTSLHWLGGQAGEAGLRAAIEGAGPADLRRTFLVAQRMNQIRPGAGDDFLTRALGGNFQLSGASKEFAPVGTLAERYGGRGLLSQPAMLATAIGQTLVGRGGKAALKAWNQAVLGTVNGAIENTARNAMLGAVIKRDFMSDHLLGLTEKAIDDAARGLMDTPNQVAAVRALDDMYGKYSKFSPEMKHALTYWTPFLPWYLNTARFMLNTITKHPVKASLMGAMTQATEEWRREHKLSAFAENQVPDWLRGSYPFKGDALSRIGQFTPFGAYQDPTGAFFGLGLPQLTGTVGAGLFGVDWTGKPLRGPDGKPFGPGRRALKALDSILGAQVPFYGKAEKLSGLGARYIDQKQEIPPWQERFKRELPLWPTSPPAGGGSGDSLGIEDFSNEDLGIEDFSEDFSG